MMVAIRYDSKTGNTKKLALAIGEALHVPALTVDQPLPEHVDLLFLGSSVYAAGASAEVKQFIAGMEKGAVDRVACFSTAALLPSTFGQVSRLLRQRGVPVDSREFHCRGQYYMLHKGKPDDADLDNIRKFAKELAGEKA